MKDRDLEREVIAACAAVRQPHIDRLKSLDVSADALAKIGSHQLAFGVMQIEPLADGYYQPGDGAECVITPIYEDDAIVDLIAWRTGSPQRWLWRSGNAWALGADELRPRWDDSPLQLHSTPLAWMRAGGEGLCILNWGSPEIRALNAIEAIEADEMAGKRLLAVLSRPVRLPRLIIRKGMRHAA